MKRVLSASQLRALCYADVFEYPLTQSELEKYQIPARPDNYELRVTCLAGRQASYEKQDDLYFLKGRSGLLAVRKQREEWSREKLQIAQHIAKYLSYIPTICMIGVTGALAMRNAKKDDDIDFLIVTRSGMVWLTRFLTVVLLEVLRVRRRPGDKTVSDKICVNMYMDEEHMKVLQNEQDVFSAHEVAQMNVLWGNNGVEDKFWTENQWIQKYLPNFQFSIFNLLNKKAQFKRTLVNWRLLENLVKRIQLFYMKGKVTNEVLTDGYLRFHPHDARNWVLKEYQKRLGEVGLE